MDAPRVRRRVKCRRQQQRRRAQDQRDAVRLEASHQASIVTGDDDNEGNDAYASSSSSGIGLLDLPDECLVEIARLVGIVGGVASLGALCATSARLARVGGDVCVWREIFAHQAGAPPGIRHDRLRPQAWADEPWSVSARRMARPLEILSGTVSLSVRSVWSDAFDPREGVAVWTMRHDTHADGGAQPVTCRDGPFAAVGRVIDDYAAHRTQCHVWLAVPVDDRDGHDAPRARTLWRPLRVVHAFNTAEPASIPWDWWWALVPPGAPCDEATLTARFIVVDLWWIDPADRSSVVPPCVAAAHTQAAPSWDGSRGAHPWYTPEFALRHVVGCGCR
ncbi:hypothetical protein psal_cds_164 [Pandoravirus salinus]|uniref:F-box domain containing protein n=1 Tax=Pandoravirus salinus TaxID=1349410 RepID=S4VZZ2_9VIRU|nr:hypothetical protein psal_cds_164 [Pandoravirus salinus]AGO83647.2 hypothetical protein psal_cds_164 [Pandoravirus salinus]